MMLARWVAWTRPRVAVPADWTGALAHVVSWLLLAALMVPAVLASLPKLAIIDVEIDGIIIRFLAVVLTFEFWRLSRRLLFAFLPNAPVLLLGRLMMRFRGRTVVVALREIVRIDVELLPDGEYVVIETRAGREMRVCPLWWQGAAALAGAIRTSVGTG